MRMRQQREAVAAAGRRLAAGGLVLGSSGNVSVAADGEVAVSPTGARLGELDAGMVCVVGLDGEHLDGDLRATSELDLHLAVHRERGDGAVVHTHAPVATALSCTLEEVPAVHYDMLRLGGAVRVAPYATFGTAELHDGVLRALEGKAAALMANHGTLVHAGDLDTALDLTDLLEWACGVYWRAASVGEPRVLDQAALDDVLRVVAERHYGTVQPR